MRYLPQGEIYSPSNHSVVVIPKQSEGPHATKSTWNIIQQSEEPHAVNHNLKVKLQSEGPHSTKSTWNIIYLSEGTLGAKSHPER